ncbi:hypothetical protein XELAEV_18016655mg [Xenopus laevis]|uniref:Uncharacterized protein n=1 Tax=Xenopus laevis TaxID=8355 RepID=A0A974DC71_XENLA|nr:hypothetical protein XELAEV_18016655mg [Xenopus laevis]
MSFFPPKNPKLFFFFSAPPSPLVADHCTSNVSETSCLFLGSVPRTVQLSSVEQTSPPPFSLSLPRPKLQDKKKSPPGHSPRLLFRFIIIMTTLLCFVFCHRGVKAEGLQGFCSIANRALEPAVV